MRKTKNFTPYIPDSRDRQGQKKCTLKTTGPGVYIIYKSAKPVYIGYSGSDVKKTMYRHFQTWNDPTQRRVTYKQLTDIKCRVVFCSPARAALLEEALILKYQPRDNELKLKLYSDKQRTEIETEYWQAPEVPF